MVDEIIKTADEYLSQGIDLNFDDSTELFRGNTLVTRAEYDTTLKEIICLLLAGKGLKLPNIQICLHSNLQGILGENNLPFDLLNSLTSLTNTVGDFLEHTQLNNVMNRLNKAVNDFATVANMIAFCAEPIRPRPIPNVLQDILGSYLGLGKKILDQIGKIAGGNIINCIRIDSNGNLKFKNNLYESGILKDIEDDFEKLTSGDLAQEKIDFFKLRIKKIENNFRSLMEKENNVYAYYSPGGSGGRRRLVPKTTESSDVGVLFDSLTGGVSSVAGSANQIQQLNQQLRNYVIVDDEGNSIKNPMSLLVDKDLLAILDDSTPSDIQRPVVARKPVLNYCGDIIGYETQTKVSVNQDKSKGEEPSPSDEPGTRLDILPDNAVGTPQLTEIINIQTQGVGSFVILPMVFANDETEQQNMSKFFDIKNNQNVFFNVEYIGVATTPAGDKITFYINQRALIQKNKNVLRIVSQIDESKFIPDGITEFLHAFIIQNDMLALQIGNDNTQFVAIDWVITFTKKIATDNTKPPIVLESVELK